MIPIVIFAVFLVLVLLGVHASLELRQRDIHLAWIEERDKHFVTLFEHAWDLTLVPRGNPMDVFKQHGMLAKDAFMRAGDPGSGILQAVDERLTTLARGLDFTVKAAKELRMWEQQHPAPPIHWYGVGGLVLRKRKAKDGRLSEKSHSEQQMPKGVLDGPIKALDPGE